MSARTPFVSSASARSVADRRQWWLRALETATAAGDAVAGGVALDQAVAFDLAGIAARCGATPFPLPFASATAAAAGFHQLLRGFQAAAQPELRAALAQAMAQAARCCRQLIDFETQQAAEAWRRRYQED